jgi:hypothetical protein
MKATIELPDELYQQVEAKSAREGRAVREVTEELFRSYVGAAESPGAAREKTSHPGLRALDGEPLPSWFGALGKYVRPAKPTDMEAIRQSIATGIARERDL